MQLSFLHRWLNTAWYTISHSFTDLNYYVDVLNSPVKRSFKLLACFYILLGFPLAFLFSVRYIPEFRSQAIQGIEEFVQYFPTDLQIDWNGSQLQSNTSQSLTVYYPEQFSPSDNLPDALAILDTTTTSGPTQSTSSLLFINQDKLFVNSQQGEWSDTTLAALLGETPLQLNKEILSQWQPSIIQSIHEFFNILPIFMYFIYSIGILLGRLLMIALDSIIVQFIFMTTGKSIPYRKAFQLSLHLLIPVEVIYQLSTILYPQLQLPMITIAYWSLIALLLWHLRNLHVVKFEEKSK